MTKYLVNSKVKGKPHIVKVGGRWVVADWRYTRDNGNIDLWFEAYYYVHYKNVELIARGRRNEILFCEA